MAITTRKKKIEAMIRDIWRRRGLGPSAVLRYLAETEMQELESVGAERSAQRREAVRQVIVNRPSLSEEQKRRIGRNTDDIHDEQGLPR